MSEEIISYLINSNEPWTRYRTRVDLLDMEENAPDVILDRNEMLDHPFVKELFSTALSWPGYPLKRHNDAKHPLHALGVLADFGIKSTDPEVNQVIDNVLEHQSPEGAFETQLQLYKMFGGLEGEHWTWMLCDMTVLLYALLSFGIGEKKPVQDAVTHLLSLVDDNGWRCKVSPMLGSFRGPGRKTDPCPMANLYALKALSVLPEFQEDHRVQVAIETLLHHWEIQGEKKYYLFGVGTDFRKLKYPFIWYDLLHVLNVLSRFNFVRSDPRYQDMLTILTNQQDGGGKYTASSMYMAWKNWSFADKKNPSPWLTFLAARIQKRSGKLKI